MPCFVLDLTPLQQLEAMVTENTQREQLTVLEEADAIQGMLDLGATTAAVAHRLGRSADYVRDRARAASIPREVRESSQDFDQLTIGDLIALSALDGHPDMQAKAAAKAGTGEFRWTVDRLTGQLDDQEWTGRMAELAEHDPQVNLIDHPSDPWGDAEWKYDNWYTRRDAEAEDGVDMAELMRGAEAVSIDTDNDRVWAWTRREAKSAEALERDAQRDRELAERRAEREALERFTTEAGHRRLAWLRSNIHSIRHDLLIEAAARLGLLQIVDPTGECLTEPLNTWNNVAAGLEQYAYISAYSQATAVETLRTGLQTQYWPVHATMLLTARMEWFITPESWTGVGKTSRRIPAYYQILETLGYQPADDEAEHLTALAEAISEADKTADNETKDEDEEAEE